MPICSEAGSLGRPAPAVPALALPSSERAQVLLRALADPIRLQLVQTLALGERCVCDLGGDLGLAQSRLSFHLKVLKEAGLIAARQQGRWNYYRLQPEAIAELRAWLAGLLLRCNDSHPGCG